VDDAVDGGTADAVLGGQFGEGDLAFGVAAADGAAGRLEQLGLLAFELAVTGTVRGTAIRNTLSWGSVRAGWCSGGGSPYGTGLMLAATSRSMVLAREEDRNGQ
jgi:hypothetical protein